MEVLKKIGSILLDILIGLVAICFLFAFYHYISIKILNNPYTNFFGYTYFNIKSGSMENTINIDDYVFVKITKDVKEDDIISFVDQGKVVTHRVISISEDGKITTKGDANNTEDEPIEKEQIVGRVVKIGKRFGVVLKVITEPIVVIPFFGGLILIDLAFTNYKKKPKEEENVITEKEN